jgi:magnesium chelatase family protein
VPKQGAGLDLPIAVALLAADGQIPPLPAGDAVLAGELGLDGAVRSIRGALAIALAARAAGRRRLVLPRADADEAALVGEVEVVGVSTLADVLAYGDAAAAARSPVDAATLLRQAGPGPVERDLADVRGQAGARRALEIAAAGGHHLLLAGPPGAGKTMLARALPGILPPLEVEEALEVTRIWSAAGLSRGLVTRRPFRAPHHGISFAGLTGGGGTLRPGEMTLATHGVLYLDELTEFRREALEALRQPLEDGSITVVRLRAAATFPARFALVASMNPCNCGFHGSPGGRCACTPLEVRRYLSKLSGPLLDRFDLVVNVPPVDLRALTEAPMGESSADVRERVVAARAGQRRRFGEKGPSCNARMGAVELNRFASLGIEQKRLLFRACERLGLSARGFDRVRRVARTLADLEGRESLAAYDVAEALQYRHSATSRRE